MTDTAAEYLRRKQCVPSHLSMEEWLSVDAKTRESLFFMVGVEDIDILEYFREMCVQIASGCISSSQARVKIRRYLLAVGYRSALGQEGTMNDLSSWERMRLTLDTYVAMARGWAQRQQMLGDIGNPGQRLYRARSSRQPRDWNTRWREAAEAVQWQGVARDGSFIALTTSPIWEKLSAFGNPYPPFDWGSGMNVIPVSFDECDRLGLVDDKMFEDIDKALRESLNTPC